jgi:hypothetical protein
MSGHRCGDRLICRLLRGRLLLRCIKADGHRLAPALAKRSRCYIQFFIMTGAQQAIQPAQQATTLLQQVLDRGPLPSPLRQAKPPATPKPISASTNHTICNLFRHSTLPAADFMQATRQNRAIQTVDCTLFASKLHGGSCGKHEKTRTRRGSC